MTLLPLLDYSTLDVGAAYRDTRNRILALTSDLSDAQWNTVVPHCPAWTARQTLAHLAGVCDDGINGNMEGVTTEPWTAAQVDKRAITSGPEIAEEWATWGPFVDARGTQAGLALAQLLFDTVTHEHDLRHALGKPGARESEALLVALAFLAKRSGPNARAGGTHLQIEIVDSSGNARRAFDLPNSDPGLPEITLRATIFDTIRSFGSRRTMDQIRALDWSADPTALMTKLVPFALPTSAIDE